MQRKKYGIFGECHEQLHTERGKKEVMDFFEEHKFCIFKFNPEMNKNKIIAEMQRKACKHYAYLAVIAVGIGKERFNDHFHRSISYVDEKMIPHKHLKKLVSDCEDSLEFFNYIKQKFGEIQIRGMYEARLRETALKQVPVITD